MGAYLSAPITEKDSHDGENNTFKFGVTAMQGWRTEMEDAHATVMDVDDSGKSSGVGFFGVFDGHGGKEVAKFAAKYMAGELAKTEAWQKGDLKSALADVFLKMDDILGQESARKELSEMAGGTEENKDRQPVVIGEDDIPEYMREALMARLREHNERRQRGGGAAMDLDEWAEDMEDTDYSPLEDLEDAEPGEKVAGADLMTKDDSSDEEATDESGQDDSNEDSEPEAAGTLTVEKVNGVSGAGEDMGNGKGYQGPTAGCTAVVALVKGNTLVVANAGDSRCVCSRGGEAVAMTQDHKPTDTEEFNRITKAGGFISDGRVNGSLNLSRALGDMEYKRTKGLTPAEQMITAMPEVRTLELREGDEFLVLACDGIWDVLTNQEAVTFVRERLEQGMEPKAICEALCDHCLAPETENCDKGCDNMSAMVVVLKPFAKKAGVPPAS